MKYADYTPEQKKAASKQAMSYYARNRERALVARKAWAKANPEKTRNWRQLWYYRNHAETLSYHADYREKLKQEIIAAYGGRCQCCGESEPVFLTIDHTFGYAERPDLYPHSRKQRGGAALYLWLRSKGFPQEGFALRCFNCNLGRQTNSRKARECVHTSMDYMRFVGAC